MDVWHNILSYISTPYPEVRIILMLFSWLIFVLIVLAFDRMRLNAAVSFILTALIFVWLLPLSWVLLRWEWHNVGKYMLINFMVGLSFASLVTLLITRLLESELAKIEKECDNLRDITLFQAMDLRAQLVQLKHRIQEGQETPGKDEIARTIVKGISPAVTLFFSKERSLVKWTLAGFNVARTIYKGMQWKKQQDNT